MHELPEAASGVVDIVRFLAMDACWQYEAVVMAEPWIEDSTNPMSGLIANFQPYSGMFDEDSSQSQDTDDGHALLMELIVCADMINTDIGPPRAEIFNTVEWSLMRRLARLVLDAFDLPYSKFTRSYLFNY